MNLFLMKLDDSASLSELVVSNNKFSTIFYFKVIFHILKRSFYKINHTKYNGSLLIGKG